MENNQEIMAALNELQAEINEKSEETVDIALAELEKKYNCDFEIKKIGNRMNTNSTTMYSSAIDNPDVVFSVKLDKETNEIIDDYSSRLVCSVIEEDVNSSIKENTACSVLLYGADSNDETNINIDVHSYVNKYNVESAFVYLAVNKYDIDNDTPQNLISAVNDLSQKFGISFVLSVHIIGDKFELCKADIKNNPDINNTWFDSYEPSGNFSFSVTDGVCNTTAEEIYNILMGGE